MKPYADLEIELSQFGPDYAVKLRLTPPGADVTKGIMRVEGTAPAAGFAALLRLDPQSEDYGRALGQTLFHDAAVAAKFSEARAAYLNQGATLRVRLVLGPTAGALNGVRWECLRDSNGERLFTGQKVLFSRFLDTLDWDAPRLENQKKLKALVAVANPSDLADFVPPLGPLAPIDADLVAERAKAALAGVEITRLEKLTADRLAQALQEGFDILFLVCHGGFTDGKPRVWLEAEDGTSDVVEAGVLAERFRDKQPRLVVLASCQSAGVGRRPLDGSGLSALGPKLAEVGVPAVVAMQGNLSMETEAIFTPIFFKELQRDGQIDRAMAFAREQIQNRPDYWVPLLYMRLLSGQLWAPAVSRRWMLAGAAALGLAAVGAWTLHTPTPLVDPVRAEFVSLRPPALDGASIAASVYEPPAPAFRDSWPPGTGSMAGVTLWRMVKWDEATDGKNRGIAVIHNDAPSAPPGATPGAASLPVAIPLKGLRMKTGEAVTTEDMFRLTVESARPGYLYIFAREHLADGSFRDPEILYPETSGAAGDNRLSPGRTIEIPGLRPANDQQHVDYMQITRSQGLVEGVISILISPEQLPRDFKPKLDDFGRWESKRAPERRDLTGGVGQAWTPEEKFAGASPDGKLNQSDPMPQTLYRFKAEPKDILLVNVPIPLKQ